MAFQIPRQNLFSHQLGATGSTLDLYYFDSNLFKNLKLPDGLDKQLVIDTILEKHGYTALAHPDPYWMSHHIGVWSSRKLQSWQKLYNTLNLEYNPIENYDRKEEITETRVTDRDTSGTTSGTNEDRMTEDRNEKTNNLHDVSAENASDYQADTKDTGTISGTVGTSRDVNTSAETSAKENTEETFQHSNRTHGNIGVTTSQQMIQAERDLVRYVLVEEIADDYRQAFCLDIY